MLWRADCAFNSMFDGNRALCDGCTEIFRVVLTEGRVNVISVALLGLPPKVVCNSRLVVGLEVISCSAVPPKLEAMPESLRTAQLVMM